MISMRRMSLGMLLLLPVLSCAMQELTKSKTEDLYIKGKKLIALRHYDLHGKGGAESYCAILSGGETLIAQRHYDSGTIFCFRANSSIDFARCEPLDEEGPDLFYRLESLCKSMNVGVVTKYSIPQ